jgi:hypothetical protein
MTKQVSPVDRERFPVDDREGYPLGVGAFVQVEAPSAIGSSPSRFKGLVTAVRADASGPVLEVREWRGGSWSGRTRLSRPAFVSVRRAPPALREQEAESAHLAIESARRAAAKKEGRA